MCCVRKKEKEISMQFFVFCDVRVTTNKKIKNEKNTL